MATPSWMESTLRRSASMGREVLERASRRSVDWTTRTFSSEVLLTRRMVSLATGLQSCKASSRCRMFQKKHTLDEAFAAIADLMAHTTCQCKVSDLSPPVLLAANSEDLTSDCGMCRRSFMSRAAAQSSATPRGITCPGSTGVRLPGREHLHSARIMWA